jgi:hypothetical protein
VGIFGMGSLAPVEFSVRRSTRRASNNRRLSGTAGRSLTSCLGRRRRHLHGPVVRLASDVQPESVATLLDPTIGWIPNHGGAGTQGSPTSAQRCRHLSRGISTFRRGRAPRHRPIRLRNSWIRAPIHVLAFLAYGPQNARRNWMTRASSSGPVPLPLLGRNPKSSTY